MADFHQNIVPTITRLESEDLGRMHQRIVEASPRLPIAVIIPAAFRELMMPATRSMIDDLVKMPFVKRVVVSLRDAGESHYRKALKLIEPLGDRGVVLWNDAPAVLALVERINALTPVGPAGKGRAVWTAFGYLLGKADIAVVAVHEANIITYNRAFLLRLLYPVVHLRYQFSKAFYARYSEEQLHGRVVRLFYFPFVRTLKDMLGPREFLEYMGDFRYPLSGEFATFTTIVGDLRFPPESGIEVGILAEMHRLVRPDRVCQVEITQRYNQKHPEVGADPRGGLQRMAGDTARTFFAHLAAAGCPLNADFLLSLKLTYLARARANVRLYEAYADINNISGFDTHKELKLIEAFASSLEQAFDEFRKHPAGAPLVPEWRRIQAARSGVLTELVAAFEAPGQSR